MKSCRPVTDDRSSFHALSYCNISKIAGATSKGKTRGTFEGDHLVEGECNHVYIVRGHRWLGGNIRDNNINTATKIVAF